MANKTVKRATAKVFTTGRSQAIRIPKAYRFTCDEVLMRTFQPFFLARRHQSTSSL